MEAHVAGCSECQRRLEKLTCGDLTLLERSAGTGQDRADSPRPVRILERVADIHPAQVRLLTQQQTPKHESEAARSARIPEPESQRATPRPSDLPYRIGEQR